MNDRRNTGKPYGRRKHLLARLSIGSLNRHDQLLAVLRMAMWSFSAVVLLGAVAGQWDLQTAFRIIAFGGLAVVVLLTGLVLTRRGILLSIQDPELREEAHRAMVGMIRRKEVARAARRKPAQRPDRSKPASCPQPGGCTADP